MSERCLQDALHGMIHRPEAEKTSGMNLFEAMKKSKEEGVCIGREGIPGWIKYVSDNPRVMYHLTAEDILAEDWKVVQRGLPALQHFPPTHLSK